jgi:beta-N-acetylhexosaminidase
MAAGIHFLIGLQPSIELTEHDRHLLTRLRPSGVILYRDNFLQGAPYDEWLRHLRRLLEEVRSCIARPRILVCIDHEGGTVHRPPAPITHYDFARNFCDQAGEVGRAWGIELASLGINVNFAPVLDVDSNPNNPVIGPRSFGASPDSVAASALSLLRGMHAGSVIGCPKHFPGHGDTQVDSHLGLPVINHSIDVLRNRELMPYRAIVATAKMVMTAHIVFPQVDHRPATLSAPLISGILRAELGYTGVVVSDDIGMKAISSLYDETDTAPLTIQAGCDLIMICDYWTETNRALTMASNIEAGLRSGSLDSAMLQRSRDRINALLADAAQHEVRALPEETFTRHSSLAPLSTAVSTGGGGQTVSLSARKADCPGEGG